MENSDLNQAYFSVMRKNSSVYIVTLAIFTHSATVTTQSAPEYSEYYPQKKEQFTESSVDIWKTPTYRSLIVTNTATFHPSRYIYPCTNTISPMMSFPAQSAIASDPLIDVP